MTIYICHKWGDKVVPHFNNSKVHLHDDGTTVCPYGHAPVPFTPEVKGGKTQ